MISSQEVEKAILEAGCYYTGTFTFADRAPATNKLDLEILESFPKQLKTVRRALAQHPILKEADVLLVVPRGAQRLFGEYLSKQLRVPLARLVKLGNRYEFAYATPQDQALAIAAEHPRIVEDVVTTLGSVAGVARLLDWQKQDVQSLAVWRRGEVDEQHRQYVKDHYIVEKIIPR